MLVCLVENNQIALREVAQKIGITERAVQKIVQDFERDGILTRERVGRKNTYQFNLDLPLRHNLENHCTIGEVLSLIHKAH